jgi:hypothetical protein
VNTAKWFESSSATIPIQRVLAIFFVFCIFSIPNVWLGSFIGFKKTTIKNPGKINKLSRDIPA